MQSMRYIYPSRIIAHRGAGVFAPENTMSAMAEGLRRGFKAVEFDVMLTRDKIPILMHDDVLGRTIEGEGSVSDFDASFFLAKDAGSFMKTSRKHLSNLPADFDYARWAGEPVPTFESIVTFCKTNGVWMNIEIKPAPGFEVETGTSVAKYTTSFFADELASPESNTPSSLPLFSSFSFEALAAARDEAPLIPRAFLVEEIPEDWHSKLVELKAVALHCNHECLTKELAQDIKAKGFGLFCFTVNDLERAKEFISVYGIDSFCTDRLDTINEGTL